MQLIVTTSALDDLYKRITEQDIQAVAIDTEFFRVTSYWPKLSLIQIAVGEDIYLIDALAKDMDLTGFCNLLINPGICKIIHAGRQDFEIFHHAFNVLPNNIFDTQVAAYVLGERDSIGLADLLQKHLNVSLDKSDQHTDWLQRPLKPKQLSYAANDVRWLQQLYLLFKEKLIAYERFEWLQEEQYYLCIPETYIADTRSLWRKVRTEKKFKPLTRLILQTICIWREEQAQKHDWNRGRVLSDKVLTQLVNDYPETLPEFTARDLPLSLEQRQQIWYRVKQARLLPREQWPSMPKQQLKQILTDEQIAAITSFVDDFTQKLQVDQRLLISNEELRNLNAGIIKGRFCQGWRYKLFGAQLITMLAQQA